MASTDEAEKAAERIMQPALDELADDRKRTARRKARAASLDRLMGRLIIPVSLAFAALMLAEYFSSSGFVALIASAIGFTVGLIFDWAK